MLTCLMFDGCFGDAMYPVGLSPINRAQTQSEAEPSEQNYGM